VSRDLQPIPTGQHRIEPALRWYLVWASAFAVTVVIALVVARQPQTLLVGLGFAAAAVLVWVAFAHPRAGLMLYLGLFLAWAINNFSKQTDVLFSVDTPLIVIVVAVVTRRMLRMDHGPFPAVEVTLLTSYFLLSVFSMLASTGTERLLFESQELLRNLVIVTLMLLLIDSLGWLKAALWAYVIALGSLALLAVLQQTTRAYSNTFFGFASVVRDRGFERSAGPFDPNYFGNFLLVAAVLAFYLVLSERRLLFRVAAAALTLVSLAALFFTVSRGSAVALAGAVLLILVFRRVRLVYVLGTSTAVAACVVLLVPADVKSHFSEITQLRSVETQSVSDVSLRGRFAEAVAGLKMFRDHPIVGVGTGNFEVNYLDYSEEIGIDPRAENREAHNVFLEALAEGGLLVGGLFLGLIVWGLRSTWSARARASGSGRLLFEGIFVAFVSFLLNGFFLHIGYSRYFWIPLGFVLVAGRLGRAPPAGVAPESSSPTHGDTAIGGSKYIWIPLGVFLLVARVRPAPRRAAAAVTRLVSGSCRRSWAALSA
jgi:O-antigen ligase